MTFDRAERVGPEGVVLGLDRDEVKLGLACAAAGRRGLANVRFEPRTLFCHPPNDAFAAWASWYPAVLRAHGGDPTVGRKLHGYFRAAGIPEPVLHLVQRAVLTGDVKQLPQLTVEATADAIVAAGIATEDEVRRTLAQLRSYLDDPRTLIGDPRSFQVWARRPA